MRGVRRAVVSERPDRTARGYRRFRCHACGKQFNERSGRILNRAGYPSDVIALVVFWRLHYPDMLTLAFAVPSSILLHALSLRQLRRRGRAESGAALDAPLHVRMSPIERSPHCVPAFAFLWPNPPVCAFSQSRPVGLRLRMTA